MEKEGGRGIRGDVSTIVRSDHVLGVTHESGEPGSVVRKGEKVRAVAMAQHILRPRFAGKSRLLSGHIEPVLEGCGAPSLKHERVVYVRDNRSRPVRTVERPSAEVGEKRHGPGLFRLCGLFGNKKTVAFV